MYIMHWLWGNIGCIWSEFFLQIDLHYLTQFFMGVRWRLSLSSKQSLIRRKFGRSKAFFCQFIKISFTRFLKVSEQWLYFFVNNLNLINVGSMQMQKWAQKMLKSLSSCLFNKIIFWDPNFSSIFSLLLKKLQHKYLALWRKYDVI